jgi:hypothetical protein
MRVPEVPQAKVAESSAGNDALLLPHGCVADAAEQPAALSVPPAVEQRLTDLESFLAVGAARNPAAAAPPTSHTHTAMTDRGPAAEEEFNAECAACRRRQHQPLGGPHHRAGVRAPTAARVPAQVYERLKRLEDRVLRLESDFGLEPALVGTFIAAGPADVATSAPQSILPAAQTSAAAHPAAALMSSKATSNSSSSIRLPKVLSTAAGLAAVNNIKDIDARIAKLTRELTARKRRRLRL